ncbi:MAG: nitrous oxide reductase family maturation protein NosD [Phycisphaerales bacterium]|nr:nitrous oxide reductase family maturation protein NosD [Phycisphaerales bacterium]
MSGTRMPWAKAVGALAAAAVAGAAVAAESPRTSAEIAALIEAAPAGATVRVPAGTYHGTLHVGRAVVLDGGGAAVLDGDGAAEVLVIDAPGVTVRGLVVRGSGVKVEMESAGIRVLSGPVVLEDNVVEDALFGIDLRESPRSVLRGNTVVGKRLDLGRRGDAIRLWRCDDAIVEDNVVRHGRDVIMWYCDRLRIRRNLVEDSRYGLHFMYAHDAVVEDNTLRDNSVGMYIMYSADIALTNNRLTGNRGPSGYGLGLKDMDGLVAEGNLFASNRVGVYVDNSPSSLDSEGVFARNLIAYNTIGMALTPNVRGNVLVRNAFVENEEQIALLGRGELRDNAFARGGQGNYWSDYGGYDRDRDGVGDLPYRSASLFENLMDREPKLRLFLYSPIEQAVDFAARTLPEMLPEPKFSDPCPLMSMPAAGPPHGPPRGSPALAAFGLVLLAAGVGIAAAPVGTRWSVCKAARREASTS